MTLAVLLLAAAAGHPSAQASATVSVRILTGERISLAAPALAPDRQLRETRRAQRPGGMPARLRLVEFH